MNRSVAVAWGTALAFTLLLMGGLFIPGSTRSGVMVAQACLGTFCIGYVFGTRRAR